MKTIKELEGDTLLVEEELGDSVIEIYRILDQLEFCLYYKEAAHLITDRYNQC